MNNEDSWFGVANLSREDHDARCLSLGPEWKRSLIEHHPGMPKQFGSGDRIWFSKEDVGSLHFFTLTMPGQLVTALFQDTVARGECTLDEAEVAALAPLFSATTERSASFTSGFVSVVGEQPVICLDGDWGCMPCGNAYKGLNPGERIYTHWKMRTVLTLDNSLIRFEGIAFDCPFEFFEEKIPAFGELLRQVSWENKATDFQEHRDTFVLWRHSPILNASSAISWMRSGITGLHAMAGPNK